MPLPVTMWQWGGGGGGAHYCFTNRHLVLNAISEMCLNLDQSKILSSVNGLTFYFTILICYNPKNEAF